MRVTLEQRLKVSTFESHGRSELRSFFAQKHNQVIKRNIHIISQSECPVSFPAIRILAHNKEQFRLTKERAEVNTQSCPLTNLSSFYHI
jgi:hypothetical protein